MKKFAGNRPLAEIIANAKAQGVAVDDYNYRVQGRDMIAFGVASPFNFRPDGSKFVSCMPGCVGWVLYNAASGRFCGRTPEGLDFNSDAKRPLYRNTPWFQALLSFFYVEKPESVFKAIETFIEGTTVIRGADGKRKATMAVKRTKTGANVTVKAAKGVDLRGVVKTLLGDPKPGNSVSVQVNPQTLYQVDSSDGGAY